MLDTMHSGGVVVLLLKLWCGGVWELGGDLGRWGVGVLEFGCVWCWIIEVMELGWLGSVGDLGWRKYFGSG